MTSGVGEGGVSLPDGGESWPIAERGRIQQGGVPRPERPWTLESIADWMDTEGSAYTYIRTWAGRAYKSSRVSITQEDREPLNELCKFATDRMGITKCKVEKVGNVHRALIERVKDQERFLAQIRPLLRTRLKRQQVDEVLEFLRRPKPKGGPRPFG